MDAIAGLEQGQRDLLTRVQVGDLLLVIASPSGSDNEHSSDDLTDSTNIDSSPHHNETESAGLNDNGEHSTNSDEIDHNAEDSDEDHRDDDQDIEASYDDTAPNVNLYRVISIASHSGGIADLTLGLLEYVLKPSKCSNANYFHVYGATITHDITFSGQTTQNLSEILTEGSQNNHLFQYPVDGDTLFAHKFDYQCPAECDDGWLDTQEQMRELMNEDIQINSDYHPVCPVCMSKELCQEYQSLSELRETGYALDMGVLVEFFGRLNTRRRVLGYEFRQFDEREWGYRFDDMLSEDDEEDGEGPERNNWDYYDEALDTATPILARPASDEAVKALPRSTYADIPTQADALQTTCQICQEDFGKATIVARLPCGHFFCSDECVPTWLKQSASCPTCRYRLPLKKDENNGVVEGEIADVMDCDGHEQGGSSEADEASDNDTEEDDEDMASDEEDDEDL